MTTPSTTAKMITISTGMLIGREPLSWCVNDPVDKKMAILSSYTSIKEKRQLKVGHNCGGSVLLTLYTQRDRAGLLLAAPEGGIAGQTFYPISSSSHKSDDGGRFPDAS